MFKALLYWLQTESKEMEHLNNKIFSVLCGIAGGMGKYFLQINNTSYLEKLIGAGITALFCGILGAAGKHLYDIIRYKIRKSRK